jgi:hypothetical protein
MTRCAFVLALACAAFAVAVPAFAQVENQLSVYTGENAKGYLAPLNDAFGASLNNGFFYSARIPSTGVRVSLEFPVMGVVFGDDQKTFSATTEDPFSPTTESSDAPTIVGPGEAVSVMGQGGTQFYFPGGFNLNSFGLVVPQLRVGNVKGTEALVRLVAGVEAGDAELGKISLFGIGARHSISQWFDMPVDLAAGFMYQTFKMCENSGGGDLVATDAYSIGVQTSKPFPIGFAAFEPYAGFSYDSFQTDVQYKSSSSGSTLLDVQFDRENTAHFTLGVGLNLVAAHAWGQFDFARQNSFSFGVAFGNLGI